jgi:hypothetical protein
MRPLTEKAYIDAKDDAILASVREQLAARDHAIDNSRNDMTAKLAEAEAKSAARLAEADAKSTRALAAQQRWMVVVVLAGITLSTSISAYMQASTLTQIQILSRQVEQLAARIPTSWPSAPAPQAPPAPIIVYPQTPSMTK